MPEIISTLQPRAPVPSMELHHASAMAALEQSRVQSSGEVVAESQFDLIDKLQAEGGSLSFAAGEDGAIQASIQTESGGALDVSELLQADCPILRVKDGKPYAQWKLESINNAVRTKLVVSKADGGRTNFSSEKFGHVDETGSGWFFDTAQLRALTVSSN